MKNTDNRLLSIQANTPFIYIAAAYIGLTLSLILFNTFSFADSQMNLVPDSLSDEFKTRVQFWKDIYTKYSVYEGVLHDTKYVNRKYKVIDLSSYKRNGFNSKSVEKMITFRLKTEKLRISLLLKQLYEKARKGPISETDLSPDEREVANLFPKGTPANEYLDASKEQRMRFQGGLKERFKEGLQLSSLYLREMEEIFKSKGLPVELTRLPFVESSFNTKARSKVGASGIWQFMPSTGRLFLKVSDTIDERNDPLTATRAAANFLANNYAVLGSWPLAITAYNHGTLGILRATQKVRSFNIESIIQLYRSPTFGFASSNFYAEFLAAVEVEKYKDKFFSDLESLKQIETDQLVLEKPYNWQTLISALSPVLKSYNLTPEKLAEWNPAITTKALSGIKPIPAGFTVKIPKNSLIVARAAIEEITSHYSSSKKIIGQKASAWQFMAEQKPSSAHRAYRSNRRISSIARKK